MHILCTMGVTRGVNNAVFFGLPPKNAVFFCLLLKNAVFFGLPPKCGAGPRFRGGRRRGACP